MKLRELSKHTIYIFSNNNEPPLAIDGVEGDFRGEPVTEEAYSGSKGFVIKSTARIIVTIPSF